MGPRRSRPVFGWLEGIFSTDLMARGHRKFRLGRPREPPSHLESARPKACRAVSRRISARRCAIAQSPGSMLSISMADSLVVSLQSGATNYESNTTQVPQIVNQSRNFATGTSFDFNDRESQKFRPSDIRVLLPSDRWIPRPGMAEPPPGDPWIPVRAGRATHFRHLLSNSTE